MKIGILTFHSQLNYGGVLQALASQHVLQEMGYEAVVIDRWLDEHNKNLLGPFAFLSLKDKFTYLLRAFFFTGVLSRQKRHKKTIRFIRSRLNLTPYHFYQWEQVKGDNLGIDLLYVGSDQVWNGSFNQPRPYLLLGAPAIPAIAYAASFGMRQLPESLLETYRQGFARFNAISCREAEGVRLVEQEGFKATHVVDPTLLLAPASWEKMVDKNKFKEKTLVCYLLSENLYEALPKLNNFAKFMKCKVKVFVNRFQTPVPRNKSTLKQWLSFFFYQWFSHVKICLSGSPQDFLDAHASATWVITDSFHSVMFVAIFDKNVRVISPSSELRKSMFARIEEFAKRFVVGEMIVNSMDEALTSFEKGEVISFKQEEIATLRENSQQWLREALSRAKC